MKVLLIDDHPLILSALQTIIEGLAENLALHGRMYCPCADVEDSKARGAEMVCPCTPHHADIARQGYCDCALFATKDPDRIVALRRPDKG